MGVQGHKSKPQHGPRVALVRQLTRQGSLKGPYILLVSLYLCLP